MCRRGIASAAQAGIIFSQDFEAGLGVQETTSGNFSINGSNAANNGTLMMGHPGAYGVRAYDYYQISGLVIDVDTTLEFDYVVALEDEYDRFNLVAALSGTLNPPTGLISPDSGMVYTMESVASAEAAELGDIAARSQSGHAVFDLSGFAGSVIDIRFQFGSDGGVSGNGVVFDNIVINVADPEPMPEAATLGLFGFGVLGAAFAAGRRRLA